MNDSTNTQTPRTDAAEQRDITGLGVVPVDFARRLECELQQATQELRDADRGAEALIAACVPGGSICDPQQVADAIREYLRPQEPCGGRCGDPECDLDTNGVTMRAPAPHADTVRLDWLSRQHYGFPVSLQRQDLPAVVSDHPSPYLRVVIDAAMKGGRP